MLALSRLFLLAALFGLPVMASAQFGDRPRLDDKNLPKDAEALPELPKADPKSEMKALLPEKTLYLEKKPDGTHRVLFVAEVCMREGPLEVFVCKKRTKEHESVLRVDMDAQFLHATLIAAGAKPGKPVQWVKPDTLEPQYKPASGTKIDVQIHYKKDGKLHTHAAQEWVNDLKTKKPMSYSWVFAGSRFADNFDDPKAAKYYCANNGEVIGISNFPDSMLDIPVEIGKDDGSLVFEANDKKIPPLGSKVWVIMSPVVDKK